MDAQTPITEEVPLGTTGNLPTTKATDDCPDYTPAVGDVVEFELSSTGGTYKGMAFINYSSNYGIVFNLDGKGDYNGYDYTFLDRCKNVRKIGSTEHVVDDGGGSINDAKRTAKAYFSKPILTGTYEEKQKQWLEHYGLKEGSKVKVVREFIDGEDGFAGGDWNTGSCKRHAQGNEMTIKRIDSEQIVLIGHGTNSGNFFPYFALEPA